MVNHQFQYKSILPKWGIINAIFTIINRIAQIEGRAGRIEYWYIQPLPIWSLFVLLILPPSVEGIFTEHLILFSILCIQCLLFIASFSAAIRRLHDIGLSGIYLAAGVFLILSASWSINIQAGYVIYITLSILIGCIPGKPGPNKYGDSQLPPLSMSPYGSRWDIGNTYVSCMKRKFQISGRASCSEYIIFSLIYAFMCTIPAGILLGAYTLIDRCESIDPDLILIVICLLATCLILYLLSLTVAFISLTIRRIHDTNHSGFIILPWLIILIITFPLVAQLLWKGGLSLSLLTLLCTMLTVSFCKITQILLTPGTNSRNAYGVTALPPVIITHHI